MKKEDEGLIDKQVDEFEAALSIPCCRNPSREVCCRILYGTGEFYQPGSARQ